MPGFDSHQRTDPSAGPPQIYWGGPDRPPRCLRDLLEERIHAVPCGGEILWVTYYFRDEGLAMALLQARRRGVRVRVVMEGTPRTGAVNCRVQNLLGGADALGAGLRALDHRVRDLRSFKSCRLHEKLYYFSHPFPCALVGTFNPSGNLPEDPAIIEQIGDQDRGHNVLVSINDPILVQGLHAHAQRLFRARHGPWECFLPEYNRVLVSGNTRIHFFPRVKWRELKGLFAGLCPGSSVRIAVSHLNDPAVCKLLFGLARKKVNIEIIAHDTERRVPLWVEEQMRQNGINFKRYVHPDRLPMHNKFMLFDKSGCEMLAFGSMNLSERSLRANHELLVIDKHSGTYAAFSRRWEEMTREI